MKRRTVLKRIHLWFLLAAAVVAVGAVACSGGSEDDDASYTPTPAAASGASQTPAQPAPTSEASGPASTGSTDSAASLKIDTGQGDLGSYLVGPDGQTLYVFLHDSPGTSNCTGSCLDVWPPLLAQDGQAVSAAEGVEGEFDTIDTPAGTQVTYNGAPLYYFAADNAPGDTKGNLVGNVWFVARPDTASTAAVIVDEEEGYLVGPTGHTLYIFDKDTEGASNCSGTCLENWPALTLPEGLEPTAVSEAGGTLALITRADDGSFEVTYNGAPLYYFAADKLPGDTKGDGVGGVWHIATP